MFRTPLLLALAATSLAATPALAQTWTQTATPPGGTVWAMAQLGSNTYAGTFSGGIYRSINYGTSWMQVGPSGAKVRSLHLAGTVLFAGLDANSSTAPGMIYRSTNGGTTWSNVLNNDSSLGQINAIKHGPGYFIAATHAGVLRSTTGLAGSWMASNTGLAGGPGNLPRVLSLAVSGSTVYAGTYGQGVFKSINGGVTWTSFGLSGKYIQTLLISGASVFAGGISDVGGVYKLTGSTWSVFNTGLPLNPNNNMRDVYALHQLGTTIYAGYELATSISKIPVNGSVWTPANAGLNTPNSARSFSSNACFMFVGTDVGVWKWVHNPMGCVKSPSGEAQLLDQTLIGNPAKEAE